MGDRTWTGIEFSGRIQRSVAEGLIEELVEQCCRTEDGPPGQLTVEHLKSDAGFYDEECNYATMEGVEGYCVKHKITYHKWWSSGGSFGEGMEIFTGTDTLECGTLEGDPVVTLSEIKKLGVGLLGHFESLDWTKYPPVEIVEDDVDEAA